MTNQTEGMESSAADSSTDDLIEIHDSIVEPERLMAEIRQRIKQRRAELGYESRSFPVFGAAASCPEPPADLPYQPDLYYHLRQANDLYAMVETAPVLASSQATRIPILGRFWKLIREQAHALVLFYSNRNTAHQVNVDRHLVSVLNLMLRELEEQRRTIKELEARLEALSQKQEEM